MLHLFAARSCADVTGHAAVWAGPDSRQLSPTIHTYHARVWNTLAARLALSSQNVDGLHQAAGSHAVVELHGSLAEVTCLSCGATTSREHVQQVMLQNNPGWPALVAATAPDGDVDLPDALVEDFSPPRCLCSGGLMPNVIFFGGNVRPVVLQSAWDLFAQADGLLVVGTSLTVFSGYRFARKAADQGMPIAIVNRGPTRADGLATVQVDAECGETLRGVVDALV